MTLLVDPPLLMAGGYALGRKIESERGARTAALALSATLLTASVSIYRNNESMRRAWEMLGGRTGKDLILNSWVFSFDYESPSLFTTAVAAVIFASYPVWALAGTRLGRRTLKV